MVTEGFMPTNPVLSRVKVALPEEHEALPQWITLRSRVLSSKLARRGSPSEPIVIAVSQPRVTAAAVAATVLAVPVAQVASPQWKTLSGWRASRRRQ